MAEEEVRADPVEVFRLRCHSRAKLWHDGEIDLHSAVDELQHAAEASGLIDAIDQAAAHGLLASVLWLISRSGWTTIDEAAERVVQRLSASRTGAA